MFSKASAGSKVTQLHCVNDSSTLNDVTTQIHKPYLQKLSLPNWFPKLTPPQHMRPIPTIFLLLENLQ